MSHYTVAVFMTKPDNRTLSKLLAPYDENKPVVPYVYETKARLIKAQKEHLRRSGGNPSEMTKEQLYQEAIKWHGAEPEMINESGDLLTTYNPESKWDWWEIGGRWKNKLILKKGFEGSPCNEALASDIDFQAIEHRDKEAFSTYAVITPDGRWHAPGIMGWWGVSSESSEEEQEWSRSYESRFIKSALENNWYMVIVDCHI